MTAGRRRNSSEPEWRLEDLAGQVLLHDERRDNWLVWMRQQNLPATQAAAGLRFSDPVLALDASKAGHGVSLVSDVLALDDLRTGTLQAPFAHRLHLPDEYRMAYPKALASEPPILAFTAFVRAEAVAYRQELLAYRIGGSPGLTSS